MPTLQIDFEKEFPEECARVREMLDFHVTYGAYSSILYYQIVTNMLNIVRMRDKKLHLFDPHAVMAEIDYLEGKSNYTNTKGPIIFKDSSISNLYHKHVYSSGDFIQNICIEMKRSLKNIEKFLKIKIGQKFDETVANQVANMAVTEAYERRAGERRNKATKGLTGEWLVFTKIDGINSYLFLGYHEMPNQEIKKWAEEAKKQLIYPNKKLRKVESFGI